MTREQLFNMIEYADDRFLQRSDKNTVSLEKPNKKNKLLFGMWKMQYVAAAVAIVLLTSITAVAAVTMIRRQAELRQRLGIEGKDVPDYVEYDVSATDVTAPADAEKGNINVTVLSGMRDELFQEWYFTVGPITEEEAKQYSWMLISDVFEDYYWAWPMVDYELLKVEYPDRVMKDEDGNEWVDLYPDDPTPISGAYDEDTQTLMLAVSVFLRNDSLPRDRIEPVTCTIIGINNDIDEMNIRTWVEHDEVEEGGFYDLDVAKVIANAEYNTTAVFTPTVTDVNTKKAVFGNGVPLTNPDTGAQGKIVDVEIYASGAVHMHYTIPEDAAQTNRFFNEGASMPDDEYLDLQDNVYLPWSNAADALMFEMRINFKDGTSTSGYVSARLTCHDGVLQAEGMSDKAIALDEIESVTIGGQTFSVE